jgi:superfamily II DNA or RNA helicase
LDNWGFSFNCEVQVINTVITRQWTCDLLIIDEIHRSGALELSKVFEKVDYKLILGLTATFERLDGRHELINKYCPICDTVPIAECLINRWVAPYKEYLVLINVDDLDTYNTYNKEFTECYEYFNFDFGLVMKLVGKNGHIECNALRNERCPNGSEEQRKQVFKTIKFKSQRFMQLMQSRKGFINNHPKKIELARKIIEARPDSKIITFSNNVKMAESIGMNGKVYTGKVSKKKGRTTIEEFNKESIGVLHTVRKADEGMDISGLSVGIVLGTDSGKTKARQRLGRVIRQEEGKQAEMFYLVLDNTVEVKWFTESHKGQSYITIDEDGLNDVLEGKEPRPYTKKLKDFTFRF